MDRVDVMKVFVAALSEGSLAGAGRKLGKSPAAVSRAITFLEAHVGTNLLHRTTRSIKLSEAGERYAAVCRRILIDLEEADMVAAGEGSAPRGTLTITAPIAIGEDLLSPIVGAFMDAYPAVSARLQLLDRAANLIDEGIDVALRMAPLPDSTHMVTRVGEVRRLVVAAPSYLATHPKIIEPSDLADHQIIAISHPGLQSWAFPPFPGSAVPRSVALTPRLSVNSVRAAIASAVEGRGVTRTYSCHVTRELSCGELAIVLAGDELPPLSVHVVSPQGRLSVPKVRSFVNFAVPRLRAAFARMASEMAS